MEQPKLKIGIMSESEIKFCFKEEYFSPANDIHYIGNQTIRIEKGQILLNGLPVKTEELLFEPTNKKNGSFELKDVTIGVQFHWERKEDQRFKGALQFLTENNK